MHLRDIVAKVNIGRDLTPACTRIMRHLQEATRVHAKPSFMEAKSIFLHCESNAR